MTNVVMQGDLVLFSSSPDSADISGINLNRPNAVVPIIDSTPGSTSQYQFTMAGGRLVFVDYSNPPTRKDPSRLEVHPLPDALQ